MKQDWLHRTQPDFLFEESQLSHIMEAMFEGNKCDLIKILNLDSKYAVDSFPIGPEHN